MASVHFTGLTNYPFRRHAAAARQVARMYYSGFGAPKNEKMAIKYYTTAFALAKEDFERGNETARAIVSDSANALGIMCEDGKGESTDSSTEQRILEAARWYRRAVRASNPHAMYNLAALSVNAAFSPMTLCDSTICFSHTIHKTHQRHSLFLRQTPRRSRRCTGCAGRSAAPG